MRNISTQRKRERQSDRRRDRQTDRQTDRKTDRQTYRYSQIDKSTKVKKLRVKILI